MCPQERPLARRSRMGLIAARSRWTAIVGALVLHLGLSAPAATSPPGEAPPRLEPTFAGTQGLEEALAALRAAAAAGEWPRLASQRVLRTADRGPEVAALRARLRASGDAPAAPVAEPDRFDDGLDAALRSFQGRHGLAADGVVGRRTWAELETTAGARVRQLEINLARRAAMPADLGDRFLVLNIAAFELAVVERGQQVFSSRAVVGKPTSPTPLLSSLVHAATFNPFWHVPAGIAQREIGPRAARDPAYLGRQGIRVFGPDGAEVDPARVDWRDRAAAARYDLRQDPGPRNALGRLSFVFPNEGNIYLHDTPQRELFDAASRAFSHGCIRIERALDLAVLLFAPELGAAEIATLIHAGETVTRSLPVPVPIHIVYWTAFVDGEGRLLSPGRLRPGTVKMRLVGFPPFHASAPARREGVGAGKAENLGAMRRIRTSEWVWGRGRRSALLALAALISVHLGAAQTVSPPADVPAPLLVNAR